MLMRTSFCLLLPAGGSAQPSNCAVKGTAVLRLCAGDKGVSGGCTPCALAGSQQQG